MGAKVSLDDNPKIDRFYDPFVGETDGQDSERYWDACYTTPHSSAI